MRHGLRPMDSTIFTRQQSRLLPKRGYEILHSWRYGRHWPHLFRLTLERGHFVTAYVRSPKKIGEVNERLQVMQGDVFNAGEMAGSMEGYDAVLSSFGPNALKLQAPAI